MIIQRSFMEHYILRIWQICPAILIFCGIIGNSMSLLVLTRLSLKKLPIASYLIALSITNTAALCLGVGRLWVMYLFDLDIRDLHIVVCKLHPWFLYWSLSMSAWMLVGMTIERVVSVYKPYKVKLIFTRRKSYIFIGTVAICLALIYCHFLFGLEIKTTTYGNTTSFDCTSIQGDYSIFVLNIFPWIDLCLFSLIPVVVQLCGNCMIICKLLSNIRGLKKLTTEDTRQRKTQVSSMTAILLTLNFVFLVCTIPISVYLILSNSKKMALNPYNSETTRLLWAIFNVLMYTNNSTTFVFFCLSGRTFRDELKAMCLSRSQQPFEMHFVSSSYG